MKLQLDFFNNKRLLVILSGVTCILIALVIFVISIIGFGNIGAFLGGKPEITEEPAGNTTPDTTTTATPTVPPSQTPGFIFTPPVTTPPATFTPETTTPDATETPTESATEEPTPTPTDVPVSTITILQGNTYTMTVGQTVQLSINILPENATDKKVTWENSSGTNVAMVNANGMVAALSEGTANITVRANGGAFAQITITVKAATVPVDGVMFDNERIDLKVGESTDLTYKISPSNATETKATWETSDNKVVSVANGTITAVGEGTATIKVTVGGKSATVEVTVEPKATTPPTDEPDPSPTEGTETTPPTEGTETPSAGNETEMTNETGENPT